MKRSISVAGGIVAVGTASLRGKPPMARLLASQGIPRQGRVFLTSAQIDDFVAMLREAQDELAAMTPVSERYDGLPSEIREFIESAETKRCVVLESVEGDDLGFYMAKEGSSFVVSLTSEPLYCTDLEAVIDALEAHLPFRYQVLEIETDDSTPRLQSWLERRGYLGSGSRLRKPISRLRHSLVIVE